MGCALLKPLVTSSAIDLEQIRTMAYKEVDKFIDGIGPLLERKPIPTLQELSAHFMETRSGLLGGIMRTITEEAARQYQEETHADCPHCSKRVQRKRFDSKHVSTLNGEFDLKRPYFYCTTCGKGFHPMDEAIGLAREVHQYDMQEKLAIFAAEMPYDRACQLFTHATGLTPGKHFGHDNINRIGEVTALETVIPDREEIERRIEAAQKGLDKLPILAVATDGAHAPTRTKGGRSKRGKGKWREVKGFRIYLLGADDRIIHIASWHQIQDWEQLAKDLELVAERIPRDKVRIALLGDGADWVWKVMTRAFPEGRQVLDYYHMSEHVCKIAKLQYGETLTGQEWKEATMTRLFLDKTGYVIGGLRRMDAASEEVKKEIKKLIGYLENHADKLGYQECRDEGIPIGSGAIESANKFISHIRLKVSGAWWLEEMGNAMLRVRCAVYNGTFDNVFKNYVASKNRDSKLS